MILFGILLSLLLITGVTALVLMIKRTNGASDQPYDVIPYVQTPGDLTDQLLDSRWEK